MFCKLDNAYILKTLIDHMVLIRDSPLVATANLNLCDNSAELIVFDDNLKSIAVATLTFDHYECEKTQHFEVDLRAFARLLRNVNRKNSLELQTRGNRLLIRIFEQGFPTSESSMKMTMTANTNVCLDGNYQQPVIVSSRVLQGIITQLLLFQTDIRVEYHEDGIHLSIETDEYSKRAILKRGFEGATDTDYCDDYDYKLLALLKVCVFSDQVAISIPFESSSLKIDTMIDDIGSLTIMIKSKRNYGLVTRE